MSFIEHFRDDFAYPEPKNNKVISLSVLLRDILRSRELTEFENQVLNETIEKLKKNEPTKKYRR